MKYGFKQITPDDWRSYSYYADEPPAEAWARELHPHHMNAVKERCFHFAGACTTMASAMLGALHPS
jgi:hypothetical protein